MSSNRTATCTLAAAQTIPVRGDVDANLEGHLRLVGVAAAAGAEVLVFPELSLTGYELDLGGKLAFTPDDARLAPLVEAAAASAMTLVVGAPLRIVTALHIGAFVVAPDRRVDVYTKHHLGAFPPSASCDGVVPPPEATFFEPGDRSPLVRLGARTAAVAVCADVGRPSHPRAAAERGATAYLASMFVIPSELDGELARLGAYAAQHRMAVVMANYGGPTGGLAAAGRSTIWSETGERLVQLDPSGAGVALAADDGSGWRGEAIVMGGA